MTMTERLQREHELVNQLVTMTARRAAADYQYLRIVRELEDAIVLADDTYPQYLAWRCGMSQKTAYENIRVARALASLPAIAKEFESGKITYSKVRLVTRIATPETDAKYATLALHGPVHFLEDIVRIHTKVTEDETPSQERRRYVDIHVADDGMVIVNARLGPDEGALFKKALEAARTAGADDNCLALAEVATAAVEKLATGDDAILHVENSEHVCTVEGHACSRATADRLICENPHRRKASVTQVRVLKRIQGGTCGFPGCVHRRFLHAHHVVHWSKGGKTKLDNLVLVCSKHHRCLHESGYTLARERGELVFRGPGGGVIAHAPALPTVASTDRMLADVRTLPAEELDPGEFFTNHANREYAMQWLLE